MLDDIDDPPAGHVVTQRVMSSQQGAQATGDDCEELDSGPEDISTANLFIMQSSFDSKLPTKLFRDR